MESDITESLRSIIKDLDKNLENSNIANESYRILIHFNKYLEEDEINEIALDNYLLFIFNKEHGIVQFVQTVLTKTMFKKPKVQCIEVFYLLVNNFPSKMEKYFREINKVCLMILKTLCTSSEEKVKALTLISLMLEVLNVNFEYTDDYMDLLNTLHHCRSLKLGESIMEKIFECMGLYVKHLDYTLKLEDTKNLQNILFITLNQEMLNKNYSNKSVAGLLTGLKHMQERISFQPVEDKKQINELYGIIKKLSQDAFKSRIKMHCRAALLFLQKDIALFQDTLYRDDKFWNDTLLKWITTLGAEERKVASKVILSFYSSICSCLMRHQTAQHKKQLMRYLILFRKTIDDPTSTNLEKQTCIHGLKIFFKAAPVLLDLKDVSNFSHKLLHKFRMTYIENQDFLSDEWALLPDYVQMVACISISKGIERGEILLLQQTLIALLKNYSRIPILLRFKVNKAFLVIVHMFKSYDFFDSFLEDLIYHCVIWSCSHQHVSEIDEDNQETVTILTYLPFWKEILNSKWKSYDGDFELDLEDWRSMTPQIVKKLIATLFISVDKLDVTMTYKECDSTDMKQLVEINKKDDFAIFLNIVDFYERLFLSTNPEFLKKYIYRVLNFIMGRSLKFPLISGFYRLLASFLKIANKMNYFSDNENEHCYEALSTFMQHLMPAVTQYEDELLISCLKVLLECPPSIIEDMLPACVTPFVTVFTMGRHYLPVADLGIETLQTWQKGIRHDLMEDFVGNVVQKLDPFLRSKSLAYLAPEFQKRSRSHRALGKRKMAVEIEPELVKLQRKMVRFLGRQSGSVCEKMLDGRRIVSDVWGDAEHLKVALPFADTKLEIYFDQMVPLVVELALYSSDRRTRVTSCELLQAFVVLFLGIGKQATNKGQEEMAGVLKKFSSAILELGCDPDEVIKALFEPLVFQMVHWYAAPFQSGKCHAVIVLEALIDGTSSSTNPNLRTFSSKCIGEFVKWTIKQWTATSLVQDPITIKALVRKMRFLSTHPDKFKKLGAALIFNNIYVFLREERSLLSMFWIEIFEIFVSSLNFIEENFENRPVIAQVNTALKNLQRGFTEKVALFKLKDERRRKPFGFEGTSSIDLLNFLLGNVKSKHSLCRKKSAELLHNLLPFLGHDQYLQEALKDPTEWLESPVQLEIRKIPQLLFFMSELHRELDSIIFLLTTSIDLDLNNLGTFRTVAYYLEFVATRRIEDVFREKERTTLLDKRIFVNRTNEINRKILVLSSHILEKNSNIDHLWNESLWRLVTLLTFSQNEEDARKELKNFLTYVDKLPEQKLEELKDHLINHIKNNFKEHLDLNTRISSEQKRILNGMIYLKNFKFNITSLYPRIVRHFVEKCLADFRGSIYLGDDEIYYYSSVLEFGLQSEFEEFVEFLYLPNEIQDTDGKKVPVGSFLLATFEDVVIPKLLDNFQEFVTFSISKREFMSKCVSYIKSILTYISKYRGNVLWPNIVVDGLAYHWETFKTSICEDTSKLAEGLELISILSSVKNAKKTELLVSTLFSSILENKDFSAPENSFESRLEIFECLIKLFGLVFEHKHAVYFRAVMERIQTDVSESPDKNTQNLRLMKIGGLFPCLRNSRSTLLFRFIIQLYLKFPDFEQYMKDTDVFETYMKNLDESEHLAIMIIFGELIRMPDYPWDLKIKLVKEVMRTVFQTACLEAFKRYMKFDIKRIMSELRATTTEHNAGIKAANFVLVEILFARLPIGRESEINTELMKAVSPSESSNKRGLLKCLLRNALDTFSEHVPVADRGNEEILRICRCCCYNTLVSIAVNALDDPTFHVKLFTRMEDTEDILWAKIVDTRRRYVFEKNFDRLPTKKKILVNIKNNSTSSTPVTHSKILRSQRIFNSSLSEDVTKHDLNNVTLRSQSSSETREGNTEIEMDQVEVNDHECMPTICALVNHLADGGFLRCEGKGELPICLRGIRLVLLSPHTTTNVKIFLVKMIENTAHVFADYADWFYEPIMKFIVEKCAGDELNFFITDLVIMLANWSDRYRPSNVYEQNLATRVIGFLFDKLSTERRDIFRYHLELTGVLMESWKGNIVVVDYFIADMLKAAEAYETDKKIHTFSLLLHNDLFPFDKDVIAKFLVLTSARLNSFKKAIYTPCSEMLGLFLKKSKERNVLTLHEEEIEKIIDRFWEIDTDKMGNILEGITIHHPEYLREKHVIKLFSRLGNVIPNSQYVFLKVMLRASSVLERVNEFRTERWEKYLNSESSDVQIITLSLIKVTLCLLEKQPSFRGIIQSVCEKKNSPNDLCKKMAFDIVIQVYEEHLRDLGRFSDVVDLCKDALMDGLASENPEISRTVREFWTQNVLSENLTERFVQSFSAIYKPKNEEVVLGNGVNFLLNLLKFDSEEAIFDHPLEDCNFEEYELSVNSSTQLPYEVPMFADSFLDRPTRKSGTQFKFGELRATQDDFTFSATVQNPALSRFTSSQSSLFLNTQNPDDFKNPNDYPKSKVLKRRFLKSREKISEYCANFEVKSKIQRVQGRVKDAKERDRQVSITRKYRKGDFPDIQISLSAIVEPLQKLAAENSDVAKMLYANLFENLKEKMSRDDWSRLSGAIATIFKTSFEFNTNLFRTLMDFVIASRSRIKLDPYLVTECCMSSSLVSTGTLIIESYLMEMDEMEPQVKRFKRTDASDECLHWIKLAELYKELNDWDVVYSIFQNKIPCDNLVKTAISAESRMLWTQARDLYRDVIEKDLTEDKKEFYFEAYFRCFAHLGQWSTISDNVRSMEGEQYWDSLWDDDWKRKKLLPWYITSEVNDMLFKEELSCSLLEDINAALSETRKAEHLKLTYPEELATLWILNEDVDSAEMYLRSSVDSFLSQWQILDPIFRNVRHKKLMNLRGTTTVYEFIDIYRMFGSVEIEKIFGHLELLWSNTRCANSCPTMMQEIGVLRYKQFLNLINSKMSSIDDPQSYVEKIKNWKMKLDLGLVDSALSHSNFYMARKYLQSHKNEPGISLYLAKMMFVKSNYSKNSPEAITTIFKSLEMLTDLSKKEKCNESLLKIQLTTFEVFGELSRILVNNEDLREDVNEKLEIILGKGVDSRGMQDYGANKIYQFLDEYISSEGLKGISDKSVSDAYLQISYYIMEKEEPVVDVLNKMVLRSMKLGASEARQLFPILLQQEHLGTTYRDVFKQESASVPTWMFLSWIPQLLANMNSENIHAIDSIVMRLTETYPQAIMYPYRLSRQNFDSQNSHLADIVKKMDSLLSNEDVDRFLRALGNVCVPEKKLSYYVEKILKNVGNAEEMEKIRRFVLSEFYCERMDSNDSECLYGNAFTRIRSYEKYFASGTSDHLTKKMRELSPELKDKSRKPSSLLKDYSPYLADFCSTKAGTDLEIPGQYDGKSMPLPQYHVKIFKFHPEITVMSSLRKPVKLTVLGNNTKEYSYLVKFGEDVRQDQRIEQLFQVMNDVFRKTEGYSRQISLETFEVIPLTSSLGLIRWVDKTIVLETFMKRCFKKFGKSFDAPIDRYAQFFFSSKRGVGNIGEAYGESAKVHDRAKIISNYKRAVGEIDSDVLRKAFWNLSTSTESFIALRHNFMRSYAVMCTAHWILGIGDRHLSNTLVGLEDGHVIGIDFGCAFGTATQMLAVPELIPFRLTPQIVAFMEPLGVSGHFRASMINTLNCLRKYKKLLVSTMSVFVKEPSLNWLEMPTTDQTTDVASSSWFPNHKINQVKRKLEGINSTEIVKEDLKDGQVKEYLNAYCELVNGVLEHDYRAQVAKEGLTVEEQVDCLIDHARDYNLLGRTYAGWKPWV